MSLSQHFSLEEALASEAAIRLKIPNTPTPEHLVNMKAAALSMEHVRTLLGNQPLEIMSWYRNPQVNHAVGGTDTSDHAHGWAIDFRHPLLTSLQAAHKIADSGMTFDQLILETSRKIVHISFAPRLRRMVGEQAFGAGTAIAWRLPPNAR